MWFGDKVISCNCWSDFMAGFRLFLLLSPSAVISLLLSLHGLGLLGSELFLEAALSIHTHRQSSHRAEGFVLRKAPSLVTRVLALACVWTHCSESLTLEEFIFCTPRVFPVHDHRLGHFSLSEIFHHQFQDAIVWHFIFFPFLPGHFWFPT